LPTVESSLVELGTKQEIIADLPVAVATCRRATHRQAQTGFCKFQGMIEWKIYLRKKI